MEHAEKSWNSFDGLTLYSQTWSPPGKPHAIINLIHGLGEHSSRYNEWAKKFTENNILIRSFDLRGHGKSEGKRGYSSSYKNLIIDLSDFVNQSLAEYIGIPVFIYGHSLGGNLLINYAIQNHLNVKGLIVSSPWLDLVTKPSPVVYSLLSILGRLFPALQVNNGLNAKHLSRDDSNVKQYIHDNLNHDRIALGLGLQIFDAAARAASCIHKINVPMLVLHGSADQITSCNVTRNFVRHSGNKTTYIEIEGGYHELHNDFDREMVFKSILGWINDQF